MAATHGEVCQSTARIRTEQTLLELQAHTASPQLMSLQVDGDMTWINHTPEKLIESVEVYGRSVKPDWKFNRQASRIDARDIAFVYESASPKLRLVWKWKAPASMGPIEYTIHIQNLEGKGSLDSIAG